MKNLTADQAINLTQEALTEKQKKEKEILAKKREEEDMDLVENIKCVNRVVRNAAEDTKTHIKISVYWHSKFDKQIMEHFRELGYSVRIRGLNRRTRCICISWNTNPFKRFLEVFF